MCFPLHSRLEAFTAITPFLGMPLFMMNGLLVVGDTLMFTLFKKRIFDFTLGTRVVPESSDHQMVRFDSTLHCVLTCRE